MNCTESVDVEIRKSVKECNLLPIKRNIVGIIGIARIFFVISYKIISQSFDDHSFFFASLNVDIDLIL